MKIQNDNNHKKTYSWKTIKIIINNNETNKNHNKVAVQLIAWKIIIMKVIIMNNLLAHLYSEQKRKKHKSIKSLNAT